MGYGPCTRASPTGNSAKERGTIFGVWNISHNVAVASRAGRGVVRRANGAGNPRSTCPVSSRTLCAFTFSGDARTPQSQGLPPVEEFKNDWPPEEKGAH